MLLPGAAFALFGTFLVLTHETQLSWRSVTQNVASSPLAYALGLAAAASWAFYSVLTRKWAGDQVKGATDIFLPATAIALSLMSFSVSEPRAWGIRPLAEAIFLGLATYFAYSLWDAAMRQGNVLLVAVGSYMTPLLSTIVSCLYLSVMPGPSLWLGCGLLIVGSLLSWRGVARKTCDADSVSLCGSAVKFLLRKTAERQDRNPVACNGTRRTSRSHWPLEFLAKKPALRRWPCRARWIECRLPRRMQTSHFQFTQHSIGESYESVHRYNVMAAAEFVLDRSNSNADPRRFSGRDLGGHAEVRRFGRDRWRSDSGRSERQGGSPGGSGFRRYRVRPDR